MKILKDSDFDSISKDIKLKNSKIIKEFGVKIKNEIIKLKEETKFTKYKRYKRLKDNNK